MAVLGSELYVADAGNHRVVAIPLPSVSASRVLGQIGFQYGTMNLLEGREFAFSLSAQNQSAAGMVIDHRGTTPYLYVADTFNHRVLGFRDARSVKPGDRAEVVIGQPDQFRAMCNYPANNLDLPTDSSLCRPIGLALDDQGNLYVADAGNSRVLRFPKPFAQPQSLPRADLVIGQASFTSKITDPTARTMALPYGLTFARNGLLVSDAAHHRVLYFEGASSALANGMAARRVFGQADFLSGAAGATDNRMNGPLHLTTDAEDRLYVADAGNNRVLVFSNISTAGDNARPQVVITTGAGNTPLRAPRAVYLNQSSGEIWLLDSTRLLRYARLETVPGAIVPNFSITTAVSGLAVVQGVDGATYVADAANRIALYYPAVNVTNAANLLSGRALAPGAISTIKSQGVPFSQETRSFDTLPEPLPLPRSLAGVEVLMNDQPVPLLYVSPEQINFIVPFSAPGAGTAELRIVRKSTGTTIAAGTVEMGEVSPALFTFGGTGSGQAAALNEDGTVSGPTNPARRGTIIALFGTGQGRVAGAPADGHVVTGLPQTDEKPRVLINNLPVAEEDVLFSGLAPESVGLWQINVRIPETIAAGNGIPLVVQFKGVPSNDPQNPALRRTTLAIRP
jgi:uncharacterized protein (TIGR03437 family)